MTGTSLRASSLACALLAGTALTAPARAQTTDTPSPVRYQLDQNGVDLTRGTYSTYVTDVTIGTGNGGLSYVRPFGQTSGGGSNWDLGVFTASSTQVSATIGFKAFLFNKSGSTFTSADGSGATLALSGGAYTLTLADGTVVVYSYGTHDSSDILRLSRGTSITAPNGDKATLTYVEASWCTNNLDNCQNGRWVTGVRLQSVANSFGYQLHFDYGRADNGMMTNTQGQAWRRLDAVTAVNLAVDYCDPAGHRCTYSRTWPSASYSGTAVTDALNRTSYYAPVYTSGNLTGYAITRAGTAAGAGPDLVVTLNSSFKVSTVSRRVSSNPADNMVWTYTYPLANTIDIADPLGHHRVITSDPAVGLPTAVKNEVNYTTQFQYYPDGKLQKAIAPEGNYVEYTYDSRGNVTQAAGVAKTGTGFAPIVTTAVYPSCTVGPACNRPTSVTDARGNTTDYTYDPGHGGVLTETAPEPTAGAVRPQTRYTYTALQAAYKNSAGSIVASGQNSYRLTAVSACQTTASCAGGADEVRSEIEYGTATPGVANNLLPTRVTTKTGNNSLVAATDTTYDDIGNAVSVDGPLSGDVDKTVFRYDAARQLVGTVSPDPDGSGQPLRNRAVRTTYNLDGLPTKVEQGNVVSQSDADWAGFVPNQAVETVYDGGARPILTRLTMGNSIYSVSQTSYDGAGRPHCAVQRMNSASDFTTPPADPCQLGTPGSPYGPDRIEVTDYDDAGRVWKRTSGYLTADASVDATYTYTANGRVETMTDAEGNKTTYEYDGHDRLSKTYFPSPVRGSGASNALDYEQLTYETTSAGTRTSATVAAFRNRANQTISFTWDALGRLAFKDLPGTEPDVTYAYDLLDRLTGASQPGHALTFHYDAFGRKTDETGPRGTMYWAWDLAGRRTRFTFQDGFFVDYDYYATGELWHVYETNGPNSHATSGLGVLGTFSYDDLGRRAGIVRGNGSSSAYTYTGPRLTRLAHHFTNAADDIDIDLEWNPAGQIKRTTRSNDLYAWTKHGSGSTSWTPNGLNQVDVAGIPTITYDAKGNLTSDGTNSYTYSSENKLLTAPGTTYTYDPLGRMYGISVPASPGLGGTFVHDGDHVVGEYNAGGLMPNLVLNRRYVFTDVPDEELNLYYITPSQPYRYWYVPDERNSALVISNDTGNAGTKNSWDEYGRSGTGNWGRVQYTGQFWLAVPDLYYYKNRIYDPKLGRFLQPDPIGYGGGPNLYGYADGDPVNGSDPSGLTAMTGTRIVPKGVNGGICGSCSGTSTASITGRIDSDRGASGVYLVSIYDMNDLSTPMDSWIEFRDFSGSVFATFGDANQGRGTECRGQFQCEKTPNADMAAQIVALSRNPQFLKAINYVWQKSNVTGEEWGFTGKGRADFRLIGGWIHGAADAISASLIASRVALGADIFFHVHPNIGDGYSPWLSSGFSCLICGGDVNVATKNGILVGAVARQNRRFYWFDGKAWGR